MADLQSNISSFIPSDINNVLSTVQNPQSFGQQILDNTKQKVIGGALDIVTRLKNEIERTILKKVELEKNHITNLYNLSLKNIGQTTYEFGRVVETPPELNDEEYQEAVALENRNYEAEKKIVDVLLTTLEIRLKKIVEDKIGPAVKQFLDFKAKVAGAKFNRETLKKLYESEKVQQLKNNLFKTLALTAGVIVIQEVVKIITNNAELQALVDKTNSIIEAAVTLPQLNQARVARNGCISRINQQQNLLRAVLKILQTLQVVLTVFGILTAILNLIPGASPLGALAKPLTIKWANAKQIRDALGATLSILIPMMQSAIAILEDLKRQLLQINERIEEKTLLLLTDDELNNYVAQIKNSSEDPLCDTNRFPGESDQDYYNRLRRSTCIRDLLAKQNPSADINNINNTGLLDLANQITPTNANDFGTYKGFRFVIKEENDPKFVVRGNKRHYAVAINTREVEQIKSDFSFTLNPQQLVDQLKFIIDQQDLQG
jgi:hypothetical protein